MNWRTRVDVWWRHLQFTVLPAHCLLCQQVADQQRDLCVACADDLARNSVFCARCALPMQRHEALCGVCLKREPPFTVAWAPFQYVYPFDRLVTQFKFGQDLAVGRVLSELWLEAFHTNQPARPDLLIPVPLHNSRLRERGFNQAVELARPLARALNIELHLTALKRIRATAAQSNLDAKARQRNVRGAFAIGSRAKLPTHVALVDDVMTTGATLREAARVLRSTGVTRVDVWAVARAP